MEKHTTYKCRFREVEPGGVLVMEIDGAIRDHPPKLEWNCSPGAINPVMSGKTWVPLWLSRASPSPGCLEETCSVLRIFRTV